MPPPPGSNPIPTSGCPRMAFSRLPKRISQAYANSHPKPRDSPAIAATLKAGSLSETDHKIDPRRIAGRAWARTLSHRARKVEVGNKKLGISAFGNDNVKLIIIF